jgi:hypothetical protein
VETKGAWQADSYKAEIMAAGEETISFVLTATANETVVAHKGRCLRPITVNTMQYPVTSHLVDIGSD